MSATGRGGERIDNDVYNTPAWCVRRLLEAVAWPATSGAWYDPCAGNGAIIRAVSGAGIKPRWVACEIRPECAGPLAALGATGIIDDYLQRPASDLPVSTIITNPPYSLAMEFVQKAVREAPVVAMLLRLNWLGGADRTEWLRKHVPSIYVLPNRPEFAASLKCRGDEFRLRERCGWKAVQSLAAPRPARCPQCLVGKVQCSTTDATEYAWFVWGYSTPTVNILASTPLSEREADRE